METMTGDYSVRESILTVAVGATVGVVAAVLLLITGWTGAGAGSVLIAGGYFVMMLTLRAMDRSRGRPAADLRQIVVGSIATGLAALALTRLWAILTGL